MKCVFLDFDGVLFDTLKEAYLLCRYAYRGTDYFEPIDEAEYKKLYRYKFLVYNSWQYYYLMTLIEKNLSDFELISEYEKCLDNRDLRTEEEFDKKYYSARRDLMENHHDFWDKLETPFPFFSELMKYGDKYLPVIVSKKNKPAIKYRLNQYGMELSEDGIVGKDELAGYETKADFMAEYMQKNGIKTAYFVDDNSNNITPCKNYPQITPLLAGWGNIAIGEVGLTCDEVIDCLIRN